MVNQRTSNTAPPQTPFAPKRRHGCLTAWLIFIIIANAFATIFIAAVSGSIAADFKAWEIGLNILLGVWTIICAMALFRWKKWGFYGFLGGAVVTMAFNIASRSYVTAFTPFISVAVLYGVLQIGGNDKGWPQLE